MKCPASKMERKNHYGNLELLQSHDEVKFVIQDRNDFDPYNSRYGASDHMRSLHE